MPSRRTVLAEIGAGTAVAGLGTATGSHGHDDGGADGSGGRVAGAQTRSRPSAIVDIGMLQPRSGALGPYGAIALRGFYTYFGYAADEVSVVPNDIRAGTEEFNLGDTTYEIDVRDTAGSAREAQIEARSMAPAKDLLAGATSSASANAIAANVANRAQVPYMAGPAASVATTGNDDNCGEYVYRASETAAMAAQTGGKYLGRDRDDIDSVYIYYADYSFGQAVARNYERVLLANGVEVAGTQPLPQGYNDDWPGQFETARSEGVDAVIGGFTVATLPSMLGAYLVEDYDFRFITGWGTALGAAALGRIIRDGVDDFTAEGIADAGVGPFVNRFHWNQYDNSIVTRANEIHREAYGANLDLFSSGMFAAASAIDQAVAATGSTRPEDIVDALKGMTVRTTLKGEDAYWFQESNNQARSPMTVAAPVPTTDDENWNVPIQPSDPLKTYGMDETTKPADLLSCDLGPARETAPDPTPTPSPTPTASPTPEPTPSPEPTVTPATGDSVVSSATPLNDTNGNISGGNTSSNDSGSDTPSITGDLGALTAIGGVLGGAAAAALLGEDDPEK